MSHPFFNPFQMNWRIALYLSVHEKRGACLDHRFTLGSLVMVNMLYVTFKIFSTKPNFNVHLKFICGLAALFSEF